METFDAFAASHVGRRRNNEDAYCIIPELGLFAVADGMGGYHGGEIASHLALWTIREFFQHNAGDAELTWPYPMDKKKSFLENMVDISVRMAHTSIKQRREGQFKEMGTTLAMLAVSKHPRKLGYSAIIAHVGDSRIYRLRNGSLQQLTRDHSLYEQLKAEGANLPSEKDFVFGNVITQALGVNLSVKTDLSLQHLQRGDRFLLCTDGLTGPLSDTQLGQALVQHTDSQEACKRLVQQAFDEGGKDNITAVVLDIP